MNDHIDPAELKRTMQRVLAAASNTRSKADRRVRRRLVDAWTYTNLGGDPAGLLEHVETAARARDPHIRD